MAVDRFSIHPRGLEIGDLPFQFTVDLVSFFVDIAPIDNWQGPLVAQASEQKNFPAAGLHGSRSIRPNQSDERRTTTACE